ncbi:MAG: mechanosensitive ion channel family protein [Anaerolineales bacterium]
MSTILEYLQNLANQFVEFLPKLAVGILIVFVAWILSRWAARLLRRSLKRSGRDPELIVLLSLLTRWGILVAGIIIAAEITSDGALGSLIAGLGIAGFTIGFALQDVAKNFVAGILLLLQQPFEIGDMIEVSDYSGHVQAITLRTTEIRTLDGRFVLIPNGDVFTSAIVNFTRAECRRVELKIGVAVDSDLDQVTRVALEAVAPILGVIEDPSPRVAFDNFGESTIDFAIHYWIDTSITDVIVAQDAGVKAIKIAFEREAIVMPYPTLTLFSTSPYT